MAVRELNIGIVARHLKNLSTMSKKEHVEKLWREFFSDPSQWWDCRSEKVNPRFPDFRHKKTQQSLWLIDNSNPPWVGVEMSAMTPGTLQVDTYTWNRRLQRYAKAGQYQKTMELFKQMQREGVNPDQFTFVPVLNACSTLRALREGRHIHLQVIETGHESDVYVGSCLVDMYAKCGSIGDAWMVFNKMPMRNAVSWNAMILGSVKLGQAQKALELWQEMQGGGVEPNTVTFVGVLNACASVGALEEGQRVHKQIIQRGYESDVFVGTSLVDMYSKCGNIEDAQRVFSEMPTRDGVTWSVIIQGYVNHGDARKALVLSGEMCQEGVDACPATFVGILNACASLAALGEGRRVHDQIIQAGYESDILVGSSLIDMYAKCGSITDAQKVFNGMSVRNVVSWNAMILGYVKNGEGDKALELYQQMRLESIDLDRVTYIGLLNACASVRAIEEGRHVHEEIIEQGYDSDVFVCNCLIHMYAKCGSILDAQRVFDKLPTRDVVAWNAMILGYVKCGKGHIALRLSQEMLRDGVDPDPVTVVGILNACANLGALEEGRHIHEQIIMRGWEADVIVGNCLIDMYAKCGSIKDATKLFDKMPTRNVFAWSAMIHGYLQCGEGQSALELSRQMQLEGIEPDAVTFVGILNACASVVALAEGRHVHEQITQRGYDSDLYVGSGLVDMYCKCGRIQDARRVFDRMPLHNAVSWTAMLGGYAMHGLAEEAVEHFESMRQEGVEVDAVTFLSLLSACSHGGLVTEGLQYFESMSTTYGILPAKEHYSCVVDLLGRAGYLEKAEDLIRSMPCKPDACVWMSLLGACRVHENLEMGERAAKQVLQLDPENAAGYVVLSNMYAAAGRWDSSAVMKRLRRERGLKTQPGRTWIEVDGNVHSFFVDDCRHPQIVEIYAALERLSEELKAAGYVPDARFEWDDADNGRREVRFCYHSEQLAIAFGLISTPPGAPLLILKNMRVCDDCHTVTKFITKIFGRAITIRDAKRFHHFENGICSCGDYW